MEILRRVNWNRKAQAVQTAPEHPVHRSRPGLAEVSPQAIAVQVKPKITRNRTGNGHKSTMVRKLNDQERNFFRSSFLRKNGEIEEDDCVAMKAGVANEVAIFQVTGFISYLHRDVALGRTQVRDLPAYKEWMRTKYGALWAQFNNPRFTEVRHRNAAARALGQPMVNIPLQEIPIRKQFSTTPNFKAFPRRGAYARTGT
jgi:hypothetical protein